MAGRMSSACLISGIATSRLSARAAASTSRISSTAAGLPKFASQWTAAFVQRLRKLGWVEDRTVAIVYRWAEGRSERSAEIVSEFVRLKVNVIVTSGTAFVIAAKAIGGSATCTQEANDWQLGRLLSARCKW